MESFMMDVNEESLFNAIDFLCPNCSKLSMIFWYTDEKFYEFDCRCCLFFVYSPSQNRVWDRLTKLEVFNQHSQIVRPHRFPGDTLPISPPLLSEKRA